jgi:hypothetical protein
VISILKAVGKPGQEIVVPAAVTLLEDKFDEIRANAAVTLEYVGSAKAVEPLMKRLPRERSEVAHDAVARALGRCGAKQEAVRKALVHDAEAAKKPEAILGPVIGLAYFEKDADTARALEKLHKKEGGERLKAVILLWALCEVMDPKSVEYVRKEVVAKQPQNPAGWLEQGIVAFNNGVVACLEGNAESKGAVEGGVAYSYGWRGIYVDGSRKNRDQSEFKPKGEIDGRTFGGGRGGGGPPPPGMGN